MKNRTILFAFFLLLVSIGYSQTCTVGYPPPSDNCATAPAIQLNGVYCGNTCNATANDAAWFKNSNEFCNSVSKQTIENNGFYIFQDKKPHSINLQMQEETSYMACLL